MTARFYQSSPTERSFQRDKSWQTPGRREHVHGRVQPLADTREPLWWRALKVAVMVCCSVYAIKLLVMP